MKLFSFTEICEFVSVFIGNNVEFRKLFQKVSFVSYNPFRIGCAQYAVFIASFSFPKKRIMFSITELQLLPINVNETACI